MYQTHILSCTVVYATRLQNLKGIFKSVSVNNVDRTLWITEWWKSAILLFTTNPNLFEISKILHVWLSDSYRYFVCLPYQLTIMLYRLWYSQYIYVLICLMEENIKLTWDPVIVLQCLCGTISFAKPLSFSSRISESLHACHPRLGMSCTNW